MQLLSAMRKLPLIIAAMLALAGPATATPPAGTWQCAIGKTDLGLLTITETGYTFADGTGGALGPAADGATPVVDGPLLMTYKIARLLPANDTAGGLVLRLQIKAAVGVRSIGNCTPISQ
jgi:hypothetical protein